MYLKTIDTTAIASKMAIVVDDKKEKLEKEQLELNAKIIELQNKIDALYEDKYNGIISSDTYVRLSGNTENLIRQCKSRLATIEIETEEKPQSMDIPKYEEKIKQLINIKKPTRDLLFTLVDKIVVDKDKNVEIIYNFNKNSCLSIDTKKKKKD